MLTRVFRRATPDDAGAVVDLVRQSFRPEDLDLTIYGCEGIAEHLRMEFAVSPAISVSTYVVAMIEDRLAGFVELRRRECGPHLNYIVTGPSRRHSGVAREMLAVALREFDVGAGAHFSLDVFEHNETALGWYRKSGFRELERRAFWCVDALPCSVGEGHWRVTGLPQAEVAHRAFGFSTFSLVHGESTFAVGRMGRGWFRVTDGKLLEWPDAINTLQAIEPQRRILFIGPEAAIPSAFRACCSAQLGSLHMGMQL